jgi:AcrR family transcriptional regulator
MPSVAWRGSLPQRASLSPPGSSIQGDWGDQAHVRPLRFEWAGQPFSLTNGVRDDYHSSMAARNPFEARPVQSRRGGPVKQPLSRDAIVTEALRQLMSNGIEGMSLRKVAAALETGPATLYAYVEDVRELQALILDQALAKVAVRPAANTSWRARLQRLLESYARVLGACPGLAQLALGTIAVGPNALRITEALLALLEEGGVDSATGAWAVDLLMLYVNAIMAERGGGADPADPKGFVARALEAVAERDYPHVHAARVQLLSGTGEERFAWALEVFLEGILRTPRPAPVKPAAAGTTQSRRRKRSAHAR